MHESVCTGISFPPLLFATPTYFAALLFSFSRDMRAWGRGYFQFGLQALDLCDEVVGPLCLSILFALIQHTYSHLPALHDYLTLQAKHCKFYYNNEVKTCSPYEY